MCSASRKNKFIQTQPPEKGDALLKPNIEELQDNDNIFFHNIIDYYQSRPDSLKDVSLASFAADYEYYKTMTHDKAQNSRQTKIPEVMHMDDNLQEDDNNEAMDDNLQEDDNCIVLNNNMGYLKRRRKSAIIRYYIGKYEDDEQKIWSIMLFLSVSK